jgi:hypothetical protein
MVCLVGLLAPTVLLIAACETGPEPSQAIGGQDAMAEVPAHSVFGTLRRMLRVVQWASTATARLS